MQRANLKVLQLCNRYMLLEAFSVKAIFSSCNKKIARQVEKGIFFLFSKDGETWSYALSMRSFSSTPSLQISSPNQR